jgi:hypothetical protein
MSFSVQAAQVTDMNSKRELAQRLSGHARAPEEALKSIFTGAMQQLEVVTERKFETPMQDRVWNKVSGNRLKVIKETFILEFCEKILGRFNGEETSAMLEEHLKTGAVKNVTYIPKLQTAYESSRSSIIDAVVQKANSMKDAWIPEIVDALRQEGVQFPQQGAVLKN